MYKEIFSPHSSVNILKISLLSKGYFIYIPSNMRDMECFCGSADFFFPNIKVFNLYSIKLDKTPEYIVKKMLAMNNIADNKDNFIIVINHKNLHAITTPINIIKRNLLELKIGKIISITALSNFLFNIGYVETSMAIDSGDFSIRGSIVDIICLTIGYRIDFFDDFIESIRIFDPATQTGKKEVNSVLIFPCNEVLLDKESLDDFLSYNDNFVFDELLCTPINKRIELLDIFYYEKVSLFLLLLKKFSNCHFYIADNLLNQDLDKYNMCKNVSIFSNTIESFSDDQISIISGIKQNILRTKFTISESIKRFIYRNQCILNLDSIGDKACRTILSINSLDIAKNISDLMLTVDVQTVVIKNLNEVFTIPSKVLLLAVIDIDISFFFRDVMFISESNIFGNNYRVIKIDKKKSNAFLKQVNQFIDGDIVTHRKYGIAKFLGLKTISTQGIKGDFLSLEYSGNEKLFVPIDNISYLTKYGENENVILDKLGNKSWQKRKEKTKEKIFEIAKKLMNIAALRKLNKADIFEVNNDLYNKFCIAFPYIETDDQLLAIDEIKKDLMSGIAMDRLICGDAGFGKTEIAIRTSFIVASSGVAQVAVLSPTKILCEQHINVFRERFKGTDIVIEGLHGLKSLKENREVKQLLKEGSVDIIIATHALFNEKIEFANIGLFIIDEEHRFGVKQKEFIKNKYPCVHILSMSATPIPRTLQMALLGVRDLSLLSSAPIGRNKINMFVKPISSSILLEATERELFNKGAVFCVCPYISDIANIKEILEKIKDKISNKIIIETLHAKMPIKEIERKITSFYTGYSNFLISTPMVEVGVDIPRANTMIVYNADLFGLSQLYQLHGRVGRSNNTGYVYFIVQANKIVNESKMRKLKILQSLKSLGMGFNVATYDMDIRGFGNLVGSEQSGHIKEIGVDLYQEMLQSCIKEIKSTDNELVKNDLELVKIDIALQAFIPDFYIKESTLRLFFYQKIASARNNTDLNNIINEIRDRFGKIPDSIDNLFKISALRLLAVKNNVSKILIDKYNKFYITFKNYKNPDILMNFLKNNNNIIELYSNDTITSKIDNHSIFDALDKLHNLLNDLFESCYN